MVANIFNRESTDVFTGLAAVIASMLAGMACIGPMAGIALGLTGLGWMSQFAYLTIPAAVVSLALASVSLYRFFTRMSCCANQRLYRLQRNVLLCSALIVVGINAIEFIVVPNI